MGWCLLRVLSLPDQFLIWSLSLCDWHSSWPHKAFVIGPHFVPHFLHGG
jgi:hypothetical protein